MIVEATEHDAVSTKKLRCDCEDWDSVVVEEEVVVVDCNTTTTKEHVHNHDAGHPVMEARSAVGQSEDVDACPSVRGVDPSHGEEGWDTHHY